MSGSILITFLPVIQGINLVFFLTMDKYLTVQKIKLIVKDFFSNCTHKSIKITII